ncbi:MAG: SGNH/GDSL hydrolase family protein [Prevotellaceae bacterium]|jgi:lysophospholipase L1-like esterase|nr:SGNH/GDSL hydrolase family protein [Prevotellaceae bacterium]
MRTIALLLFGILWLPLSSQIAERETYLDHTVAELQKQWPQNRTVNFVFHGHSVPSGYFRTPDVRTLESYPQLVLKAVKEIYPFAVVNAITTAVGGENSEQGAARFRSEVLVHRPDVLFIDYALNDRGIGLKRAKVSWERMIEEAISDSIRVILLTPTPDTSVNILDKQSSLAQHACQICELAAKYHVGLADSYTAFREKKENGDDIVKYMSQINHPNKKGHEIVCDLIVRWLRRSHTTNTLSNCEE